VNRIATAAPALRASAFTEAGIRQRMASAIVEKDFWVCWMLGLLFGHPEWSRGLVFKGGTSLSKVFNAINRFSEDIDLSLCPGALGIDAAEAEKADSRRKRDHLMGDLEARCSAWVETTVRPELEERVVSILGARCGDLPWLEQVTDETSHSPVLNFHYPCEHGEGLPYIRRVVKLEFGSLTDQQPTGAHRVRPWVADSLNAEMREMGCEVVALEIERTFWEKATILHAEHYRAPGSAMPARYSRHYADLASLFRSGLAAKALDDSEIRQRVVDWKNRFFARAWARYDLAQPGTFRLLPASERMSDLERDYNEMREMFIGDPLSFSTIMDILAEMEGRINQM
jgi:hypothetical protein